MSTLIIGFGISGRSAAQLLLKQGKEVIAIDKKALEVQTDLPLRLYPEEQALDWGEIEQVVLSPGVAPHHPQVVEALAKGIEVIGEIELGFRALTNPCIGVTGTNGKTTTVLLIEHVLKAVGKKARALGNIGAGLCAYALDPDPEEILVVELSSFQLERLYARRLDAALFLNLTPDHLDRYASLEEYARAKCRIEGCLKQGGALWVSLQVMQEYGHLLHNPLVFDREESVAPIHPIRYIQCGRPELQNVQASRAICRSFGVAEEQFASALQTFRKPHHRIEYVEEWEGIFFYDDSKATNIDSVLHALKLFEGEVVLLAGGVDKGASYLPWREFAKKVKKIVAFGEASEKIEAELKGSFPLARVSTMEQALKEAVRCAERGCTILLSPGCSSFDQFRNYEHRGNEFKRLVKERVWIEEKRS